MPKIDVNDIPEKSPEGGKPVRNSGQEFVKWIGPAGIVLFLGLLVFFFIFCFSGGDGTLDGYVPPENSEYYAQHLDEFKTELEDNMLPLIARPAKLEVTGDTLTVTTASTDYGAVRRSMVHYYNQELFIFQRSDG